MMQKVPARPTPALKETTLNYLFQVFAQTHYPLCAINTAIILFFYEFEGAAKHMRAWQKEINLSFRLDSNSLSSLIFLVQIGIANNKFYYRNWGTRFNVAGIFTAEGIDVAIIVDKFDDRLAIIKTSSNRLSLAHNAVTWNTVRGWSWLALLRRTSTQEDQYK